MREKWRLKKYAKFYLEIYFMGILENEAKLIDVYLPLAEILVIMYVVIFLGCSYVCRCNPFYIDETKIIRLICINEILAITYE